MRYDVLIIGGGIVGLATALRLKEYRPALTVAVLDKETGVARHQTGHNSGVIHSGIYYQPGSLKAKNCRRGYDQLLAFCDEHGIPYEKCGKVIVATRPEEVSALERIRARGEANGLEGIRRLTPDELREHEPHAAGVDALFVPQTGIVDYVAVARKYAELFQRADGDLFLGERVTGLRPLGGFSEVVTQRRTYEARLVVNCAGLLADRVAQLTGQTVDFRIVPFRGEYYTLRPDRTHLVKNLIYPVPDPNFPFLGVHFTRMIGGGVEAGPNAVLAFRREGYRRTDWHLGDTLDTLRWPGFRKVARRYWQTGLGELYRSYSKAAFTRALQRLLPDIREADLLPAPAGVRAQACDRDGGLIDDFKIVENAHVVNVCNAPSPAATSSLSIGQTVAEMALTRFD